MKNDHNRCPTPLCGRVGGFTYISIVKRLGAIMDKMIENNPQFSEEIVNDLRALANEISDENGKIPARNIKLDVTNDEWKLYEKRFDVKNKTWLDLPWFFVENYFYRLILDITGYFDPNSPNYNIDPFERQKRESLLSPLRNGSITSSSKSILSFYSEYEQHKNEENLRDFIYFMLVSDLWGNQADLSFSGGATFEKIHQERENLSENIIINDAPRVVDMLLTKVHDKKCASYGMIVDNCGQEFVNDLFFAEVLTHFNIVDNIVFYVKSQPVFVSDVMEKDVTYTLEQLSNSDEDTAHFGKLFKQYFDNGKWIVKSDSFFTSPLPFWELSEELKNQLAQHNLIIIKGDANYRRLINDALWSLETNFSELLKYLPCDAVALRTLKSDALIGMLDGSKEREMILKSLSKKDPEWRVNGKYGVIQYKTTQ
jgi:uncharacterized protein with ATP-grasp and redox domains